MASQFMTVSRICVLLWFTIFFETVRTTTPSTFTDADTSPLATDHTTENVTDFTATTKWKTVSPTTPSTFTDADTSTYATDSTTDNMTDFATTTISNSTTDNMTDIATTTIWNNTTENMTMATDLPATTISNNATENGTMPTDIPPTTIPRKITEWVIIIITTGGFIIIIVILVVIARQVKLLSSRKSPDDERTPLIRSYEHEAQFIRLLTEDALYEGRISYYELRKLVQYASEHNENDKLEDVIKNLLKEKDFHRTYGSTDKSDKHLYQLLCDWKKQCDKPGMNQLKLLFEKCIAAKMMKSIQKLRNLRRIIFDVPDSTSNDLEHILWQIGKKSKHNITNLLEKLNVENAGIGDPSNYELKKIVDKASRQLQEWKQGLVPINPIVMISLALEDLKLIEVVEETAAKSDISECSRSEED